VDSGNRNRFANAHNAETAAMTARTAKRKRPRVVFDWSEHGGGTFSMISMSHAVPPVRSTS
jgi:hypothetical protein